MKFGLIGMLMLAAAPAALAAENPPQFLMISRMR